MAAQDESLSDNGMAPSGYKAIVWSEDGKFYYYKQAVTNKFQKVNHSTQKIKCTNNIFKKTYRQL